MIALSLRRKISDRSAASSASSASATSASRSPSSSRRRASRSSASTSTRRSPRRSTGASYIKHIGPEAGRRRLRPRPDPGHDRLRPPRRVRRHPRLRPDAARQAPRARHLLHPGDGRAARPTGSGPASSSSSSRRPTPARRARRSSRRSRRGGWRAGGTSSSPSRPEREDPGNQRFHTRNIPKVVGGIDPASHRGARRALYEAAIDEGRPVSLPRGRRGGEAPREHLPLRQHRPRQRAEGRLRPDGDRRLGGHRGGEDEALRLHALLSRPGLGGHCIPLDPFYLTWKAARVRSLGALHRARGRDQHLDAALRRRQDGTALNDQGKSVKGSKVLVLGLSYKADIDDDRESPSFEIIEQLRAPGRSRLLRPLHPGGEERPQARHRALLGAVHRRGVRGHDVLVVSTAHSEFKDRRSTRARSSWSTRAT